MAETAVPKKKESSMANKELTVNGVKVTGSDDNGESPLECAAQSTKDQWKEVRI